MAKALKIVAKKPGFRRAGRSFGDEPTFIPVVDLKKDEIEALQNERMLVVHEVDIEDETAAVAKKSGKEATIEETDNTASTNEKDSSTNGKTGGKRAAGKQ